MSVTELVLDAPDSDEGLRKEVTSEEQAAVVLQRELPYLINDVAMLIGRPFRFVWDPSIDTASTDCLAEIRVSPWPFLEGERRVGYGMVYHETGHIRFSPYGVRLLERAQREGGQILRDLMNIILDRKDDYETAQAAPGFAEVLRERLLVIGTLARRKRYEDLLGKLSPAGQSRFLRHAKPQDPFEDFFFAAKWHKRPRFRATHRAMKYVSQRRVRESSPEELFWIAKRVREILASEPGFERRQEQLEQGFTKLYRVASGVECGTKGRRLTPALARALNTLIANYLKGLRRGGIGQLLQHLKSAGLVHPGPISVGMTSTVPVKKIPPDPKFAADNERLLSEVKHLVTPLVRRLKKLDTPSEIELYGRDEGELDLIEAARIATGLSGYYRETVVERDIDAELHLAIDSSGSMQGEKVLTAKKIATVFSAAIRELDPICRGRLWSFNSRAICDYGPPASNSGFVSIEGDDGNSDTHMLKVVGTELAKSTKRRKVLLVLCDDGPDNMERAKRLSQQLVARGIIVVHLLVGVHGTPDIYPIELLYTSMEECLEEFGDLLKTIISHLK